MVKTVEELQKNWRNPYLVWWALGMPAFVAEENFWWKQIQLKFPTKEDRLEFARVLNIKMTENTFVINHPEKIFLPNITNRYIED